MSQRAGVTKGLSRREYAIYRRCRYWGVPYTKLSRTAVFKRDRWICQLCNEPIPSGANKLRYPHPLSPSIDHRWPLSIPGGPGHCWSNVQAAHLGCNTLKSNRSGFEVAPIETPVTGSEIDANEPECPDWIDHTGECENPY